MSDYHNKISRALTSLLATLLLYISGCSPAEHPAINQMPLSIVDEYDKNWLQSGRDKFIFHDAVTKAEHLGSGWKLDTNSRQTRFPWPRFTETGGVLNLSWTHRMERRVNIRLLNISRSHSTELLRVSLNGHRLTQMNDDLPIGEYSFYIPSAYQVQGSNALSVSIDPNFSDKADDFNAIGLHSVRVTLGAVVKNVIQIGDQVRHSLLFAPPIALQVPYNPDSNHRLNFSYGLYSFSKELNAAEYELDIKLIDTERSKTFFTESILIKRSSDATENWVHTSVKLPKASKNTVLELSFHSVSDIVSSDYLALSEMFLIPDQKHYAIQPQGTEPDILLFTLASVATSQLGCYGNPLSNTPFLDHLSKTGYLHADMTTASNSEVPALVSLATGKYPRDHGYYRHNKSITGEPTTVPELFLNGSYQSHGYIHTRPANQQPIPQLDGFRRVYLSNPKNQSLDQVMTQFTQSLSSPFLRSDQGFFWIHLAPEVSHLETQQGQYPLEIYSPDPISINSLNLPVSEQQRLLGLAGNRGDDLRYVLADGDYRLAELDSFIFQLVARMKARRKKRDIVILVQSDHGIIRSIDSNPLSADSLSQEVVHIPFLMGTIRTSKDRVTQKQKILTSPVSSIKVYDVLRSLSRHPDATTAMAVLDQSTLKRTSISPIFAEHAQRPIVMFRKKSNKMIHCLSDPYFQIATTNLFELNEDPEELVNLAGKDPTFTRQFLEPVLAFCRGSNYYPEPQPGLDEEALEILQSLKYCE